MAKTILVVEDEKNLVELLRFRLEANGYRVETVFDGEEAVTKAKELIPDLIILDVMIPKLHGYDVCEILKKNEGTKDIPILILTARAQDKDKEEGERRGADTFLTKPFEPAELLKEIEKLLNAN